MQHIRVFFFSLIKCECIAVSKIVNSIISKLYNLHFFHSTCNLFLQCILLKHQYLLICKYMSG